MAGYITKELKNHAPFTLFGTLTGILIMFVCRHMPEDISCHLFYLLHPIHVVLSAIVTASIYELHTCKHHEGKCNLWILIPISYIGTIGIATISDSVIPYIGESLLNMPNRGIHLGFIEKWWIVNPSAIFGIMIAYFRPTTKLPHAGHVLLSTWASLFHMMMAGSMVTVFQYTLSGVFLFLAVLVPCCVSDIVFPLLFVSDPNNPHKKIQY